jgi:hypothetical protein
MVPFSNPPMAGERKGRSKPRCTAAALHLLRRHLQKGPRCLQLLMRRGFQRICIRIIYTHVYIYIYICVCMYACMDAWMYVCMCVCVVCVYVCVCVYIYRYIYIHMYTTYTSACSLYLSTYLLFRVLEYLGADMHLRDLYTHNFYLFGD